jgi:hypothetical protein
MAKGKCRWLDYENNKCLMKNHQCEGCYICEDYQEEE